MPAIDVQANLTAVRERIAAACLRAGRDPGAVQLVAISKRIPWPRVAAAIAAGQLDLGENRLQDALARQDDAEAALATAGGPAAPVRWHFVGHLQRNKATRAAGRFALIHGVHSLELAERLHRKASALGVVQPVLLQANVTGEPQKDGLAPEAVAELACRVSALAGLDLRGLMTMARLDDAEPALRRTFATLRELRDAARAACGRPLPHLSMGMSQDFEAAIAEGATLVRIGTAVFGPREG